MNKHLDTTVLSGEDSELSASEWQRIRAAHQSSVPTSAAAERVWAKVELRRSNVWTPSWKLGFPLRIMVPALVLLVGPAAFAATETNVGGWIVNTVQEMFGSAREEPMALEEAKGGKGFLRTETKRRKAVAETTAFADEPKATENAESEQLTRDSTSISPTIRVPPTATLKPRPNKNHVGQFAPAALVEERRLLQRAQQALASGQTDRALAATAQHRRRFPNGILRPEREVVRI